MSHTKVAFAVRACKRALRTIERAEAHSALLIVAGEVNATMQRMHEAKTNPRKIALAEKRKG